MIQSQTEQAVGRPDSRPNAADRVGGLGNLETDRDRREESIETGTDVDKVSGLDEVNTSTKHVDNSRERHPERDEHGRL